MADAVAGKPLDRVRVSLRERISWNRVYRTVSYLTNALRLPLEADAARFPPPYIDASSIAT